MLLLPITACNEPEPVTVQLIFLLISASPFQKLKPSTIQGASAPTTNHRQRAQSPRVAGAHAEKVEVRGTGGCGRLCREATFGASNTAGAVPLSSMIERKIYLALGSRCSEDTD